MLKKNWTRTSFNPAVFLSLSFYLYLSLSWSICRCLCLSVYISLYLSLQFNSTSMRFVYDKQLDLGELKM